MLSAAQDLPEDPALLKAMIADLQAQNAKLAATVRAHDLMVQTLRLRIAKSKKQAFGKSSEKIEREIEQLELAPRRKVPQRRGMLTRRRRPCPLQTHAAPPGVRASRRIRHASARNSTRAAPVPIAGASCA